MKLMRKIIAFVLCLCCAISFSGCSAIGLAALSNNEEIAGVLPEYNEEDAEAVKDLVGDIAGIAADTYKEHFGEIDIGEIAENVDRDKVAEVMDDAAGLLKDGIELWGDVLEEIEESSDSTIPETEPTE